jgi:hypothetical protein
VFEVVVRGGWSSGVWRLRWHRNRRVFGYSSDIHAQIYTSPKSESCDHVELLFRTPTSKLVRLSSTTTNHPYSPLLGVKGPQDMSHQETWVDLESPSTLNFGVQRGFGVSRWGSRRTRLEPWVSFFSFDITLLTMTCRWTATSTRKATTSKPPPNKDMDEDNRGLRRRCVLSLG